MTQPLSPPCTPISSTLCGTFGACVNGHLNSGLLRPIFTGSHPASKITCSAKRACGTYRTGCRCSLPPYVSSSSSSANCRLENASTPIPSCNSRARARSSGKASTPGLPPATSQQSRYFLEWKCGTFYYDANLAILTPSHMPRNQPASPHTIDAPLIISESPHINGTSAPRVEPTPIPIMIIILFMLGIILLAATSTACYRMVFLLLHIYPYLMCRRYESSCHHNAC